MRGQRVVVTGPNGFVGRHLVRALTAAGAVVHGIGLGGADTLLSEGVIESWTACDLMDADALRGALGEKRPDAVFHLAGQSSAAYSFEHPLTTYEVNGLGTCHLLEAVRREAPAARVLVVGTSEIYGPQPDGTRVSEEAAVRPVSPYALSKAIADSAAEYYGRVHGLAVVRTRSFAHIGPGQESRFVVPGCARQIAAIETGRAEPVLRVGNLEVTRDFTDVRDVVEAYQRLIEHGRCGAAYNVCRGAGVRLGDLVRDLCARSRIPVRVEVDQTRLRPADVPYLVGDPAAIQRDTGWQASRSLEAVLDEVLDEWRHQVTA